MNYYNINFICYADSEEEANRLGQVLTNFVKQKYNEGVLVTAEKVSFAISNYGDNFLINNFLRNGNNNYNNG